MDYQEFIALFEKAMTDRLGAQKFRVHKVTKNNGVSYDGIIITPDNTNISPTINLLPYYNRYMKGDSLDAICDDILTCYQKNLPKQSFDPAQYTDFEKAGDHIIYRLVNYKRNEELLKKIPHVRYLDFAVIFYYLVGISGRDQSYILIYNEHLDFWKNVDTDTLLAIAGKNTPKLLPAQMEDIANLICSVMGQDALPLDELDYPVYILTNKYRTNGATVLLYDRLLSELSNHFESDFVIIPSSIHEVLVFPAGQSPDPEALRTIIAQVNGTELTDEEILSDNAYYYRRKTNELCILE